jgi:hypothetical protein
MSGEGFETSRQEDFWSLALVVKGCASFEESIVQFLQKETLKDYFAEGLGRKIDITVQNRIRKIPDFLVIQLKRFEYNLATWARYKVNEKFEFPKTFDLAPLLEAEGQHQVFKLTGVVLHCGTADAGHYTSCIELGGVWYEFNDSHVVATTEAAVFTDAFGGPAVGQQYPGYTEHRPSAYMLFYTKADLVPVASNYAFDDPRDSALIEEIRRENAAHTEMQSLFCPSLMSAMCEYGDLDVVLTYFLSVFRRSQHTALAQALAKHLIDLIVDADACRLVLGVFVDAFGDVLNVFVHCTHEGIHEAFNSVVTYLLQVGDVADTSRLVLAFIDNLADLIQNWRVMPAILNLIITFSGLNTDFVFERDWIPRILAVLKSGLEGAKSSVYLQNINFSSVFQFLTDHITSVKPEWVAELAKLAAIVIQGTSHSDSFMNLMFAACSADLIPSSVFIDPFLQAGKAPAATVLTTLIIRASAHEPILSRLLSSPRLSRETLITTITNLLASHEVTPPQVVSNGLLLFHLLARETIPVLKQAEKLSADLFHHVSPLRGYSPSEIALTTPHPGYVELLWKDAALTITLAPAKLEPLRQFFGHLMLHAQNIPKDPSGYLSAPQANEQLTRLLRVLLWSAVRSEAEITAEHADLFFALLAATTKANLTDDCNKLELLRIISILRGPVLNRAIEDFDVFMEYALSGNYTDTPLLGEWTFLVFFHAIRDVIDSPLMTKIIASPHFAPLFRRASRSPIRHTLGAAVRAVQTTGIDFCPVLQQHLDIATIGFNAIYFVRKFPAFPLSDALLGQLFVAALAGVSAFVMAGARHQRIQKDLACLASLAEQYTISEPGLIIDALPDSLTKVIADRHPLAVSSLIDMLVLAASKRAEICDALLARPELIGEPTNLSWGIHLLRCRLAIIRGSALDAVTSAKEKYVQSGNVPPIESAMTQLMADLLEADFETHREWARAMLMADLKSHTLGRSLPFMGFVAAGLPQEDVLIAARIADEVFHHEAYMDFLLAKIDIFVTARPEWRDEILEAANLTPVRLARHAHWANKFKSVFEN